MKLLLKFTSLIFNKPVLVLLALLAFADFLTETAGLPPAAVSLLETVALHNETAFTAGTVRAGLFNGLVLHDADIKTCTPAGTLHLRANSLRFRLNPFYAIRSNRLLEDVNGNNLNIKLFDGRARRLITSELKNLHLRSAGNDLAYADMEGDLNGVRLSVSAQVANLSYILKTVRNDSNAIHNSIGIQKALAALNDLLARCSFGKNDFTIRSKASIDCLNPDASTLENYFDITHAAFDHIPISKLHGIITYGGGKLKLENLTWLPEDSQQIKLQAEYDLNSDSVSANTSGRIYLSTVLHLAGLSGKLPKRLSGNSAVLAFTGELPSSKLLDGGLDSSVFLEFQPFQLGSVGIDRSSVNLKYSGGILTAENFILRLNKDGREHCSGNLFFNTKKATGAADIYGTVNLINLAEKCGITIPECLTKTIPSPTTFRLKTSESAISPDSISLSGTITQNHLELFPRKTAASMNFSLEKGRLSVCNGTLADCDSGRTIAEFSGESDLTELMKNLVDKNAPQQKNITVTHSVKILGKTSPAAEAQGTLKYSTETGQLSLSAEGTAFPDILNRDFLSEIHGLEGAGFVLQCFKTRDIPAAFTLESPWINAPADKLDIRGTLKAWDTSFNDFHAVQAESDYCITGNRAVFKNMRGTTVEGYSTSLEMDIQYYPFVYTISDIVLKGDPVVANAFIFDRNARKVYSRIWEDITWDSGNFPEIKVPLIQYQSDVLANAWMLELKGGITAENIFYRKLPLEKLETGVNLELPGDLELNDISLKTGELELKGDCSFTFGSAPYCTFTVKETSGSFRPGELLEHFNPKWADLLENLAFSDNTHLTCNGALQLTAPNSLKLNGTLESADAEIDGKKISDIDASWSLNNELLRWDVKNAGIFQGNLKTTGFYDLGTSSGSILARANKLQWSLCSALATGTSDKPAIPGNVNMECKLNFVKNWAGRPLHIEGSGHFALREADLWAIPLMKQLSTLLNVTSFKWLGSKNDKGYGQITALDADLVFLGSKISVPRLTTNGTIIALSGNGEYSWEKDRLHFHIAGEPLKNISLVSVILKPLSWAFQAELEGTRHKSQWKLSTPLSKLFMPASEPELELE